MYFKKLEITGFKSFMERTVLNFEPGVTAVVGPNGCGKSNIFDSIRWVLGEQSAKSLRGSQMEDVIFNGTDSRQAVGMAEVSLSFDNSNKFFAVDSDEVTVTRRLFRSGESEYLLNRAQVRLKDLIDLFAGTGIGAESYSIVAQGKIDLILSSRPEDRRSVFDEASGITRYKSQKREAGRKLEETDQNLVRLNDIISEVKRSIGYLERQANKARRYQTAFDELKDKELRLAVFQKKRLTERQYELGCRLQALREREAGFEAAIQDGEEAVRARREELEALDRSLAEVKNRIAESENTLGRNIQQITFNEERILETEKNAAYIRGQVAQARERLAQEEEKLVKLREERGTLTKNLEENSLKLRESEEQLTVLVAGLKQSNDIISSSKDSAISIASEMSAVRNEISDATSKQHVCSARAKRLELEKAKSHEERGRVEATLEAMKTELSSLEAGYAELSASLSQAKTGLEEKTRVLMGLNETLEILERRKLALSSQKEFLDKLKNQYEDMGESMNAVISLEKQPSEPITGLVIKVREQEQGQSGYVLKGEAKPVDFDAQRVNERLLQTETEIAGLRTERSRIEAEIRQAEDSVEAFTARVREQEVSLADKRASCAGVNDQFTRIKEEEELILFELSDVEAELVKLEHKNAQLRLKLETAERENERLQELIHQEQEKINSGSRVKEEILVRIASSRSEVENVMKRLAAEESTFEMLENSCSRGREAITELNAKIEEGAQRSIFLKEEIENLRERNSGIEKECQSCREGLAREQARFEEFQAGALAAEQDAESLRSGLGQAREQVHELEMARKDLEFEYQSMKERLSAAYKIDLDTAGTGTASDPAQLLLLWKGLRDEEPLPLLLSHAAHPSQQQQEPQDEASLTEQIGRLREKVESYGTVNLVAIDEYEELKKRYDFLNLQQADLLKAKAALQDAIQKINRTTRKLFLETFERVKEEFRNYFKMLFNGGDAQMYLVDEQDPLESGIDIICRPPGKKLQNVLLLSGGEKSLSAIALIFAIFKVKPAPFCILDEIDAALDESNVERFSRMFQEFTGTSQFIVITHNKRTIANADVMYGITMQESGVSKIVSVKFSEKKSKEPENLPQVVAAA